MKITSAFSFFFFFLLALFGFTGAEFIYDSDGDILKNGGNYYILPAGYGGAVIKGAAISASKRSSSCSLAVVADVSYDKGWAANITTPFPLNYITNDYPLNISFANLPSNACTNTPDWVVTNVIGFDGEPIMVGKFEEFSLPRSGYFYIKPYGSTMSYKFAFCYSEASCGYVVLKTDTNSNHRLAVSLDRSKEPLVFKLVKATSSSEKVASDGISMVV